MPLPSKSTDDREDVDGDREHLLDSELPPGEEFPEGFPVSVRHLDTDPFLRIQKEEPDTWSASVPEGVAAALKTHEAKRQVCHGHIPISIYSCIWYTNVKPLYQARESTPTSIRLFVYT